MTGPSEHVTAKAGRYLTAGRVLLLEVTAGRIVAQVVGSADEPYRVVWTPVVGWTCSCPNIGRAPCSHLAAVQTVTVAPRTRRPAAQEPAA